PPRSTTATASTCPVSRSCGSGTGEGECCLRLSNRRLSGRGRWLVSGHGLWSHCFLRPPPGGRRRSVLRRTGRVMMVVPTYKDYLEIPGGYIECGETPT